VATIPSKPERLIVRPSPCARRLLLHLFSIGEGWFDVPFVMAPFQKPGVGVTWVKSGRCQLRLDDTLWDWKPEPCFWFYGTQQERFFKPVSDEPVLTRAFWFGGPGLDGWLEALDVKRQPHFRLRYPERIYRAYHAMMRLARKRPPNWEWKVHQHLASVLGEFLLARKLLLRDGNPLPPPIAQALDAVEADPARDWKTSELATAARMSYTAFRILFRDAMHESPHAWLQRIRLDQAREMLTDPKLRIKEIARRLHFSSDHYLSNFFHKHTGLSPTHFRRQLEQAAPNGSEER